MRCRGTVGMTLVEILVSVALGMILVGLGWTAFIKARSGTTRTLARVDLHRSAAFIDEHLRRDISCMGQATAAFVASSQASTASTRTDTLDLVFMRSIAPLRKLNRDSTADQYLEDLLWVRWRFQRKWQLNGAVWQVVSNTLYRSASTPQRRWTIKDTAPIWVPGSAIADPNGGTMNSYAYSTWLNIPRPLRDASQGIASLDCNRYQNPATALNNPATADIGDLTDLDNNQQVVSARVRDASLSWTDAQGSTTTVTSTAAATCNLNGLYLDVVGPDNGHYLNATQDAQVPLSAVKLDASDPHPQYDYRPDLQKRPRILRLAFNLADAATGVSQDFAISVATTGLQPPIGP